MRRDSLPQPARRREASGSRRASVRCDLPLALGDPVLPPTHLLIGPVDGLIDGLPNRRRLAAGGEACVVQVDDDIRDGGRPDPPSRPTVRRTSWRLACRPSRPSFSSAYARVSPGIGSLKTTLIRMAYPLGNLPGRFWAALQRAATSSLASLVLPSRGSPPHELHDRTTTDAQPSQRPSRKLDGRLGPEDHSGDSPRPDRVAEVEHPAVAVDKGHVDGKAHKEHVDRVAVLEAECLPLGERRPPHQPPEPGPEAVGDGAVLGDHRPVGRLETAGRGAHATMVPTLRAAGIV